MTDTDPLIPMLDAARRLGIAQSAAYARLRRRGTIHPLLPAPERFDGSRRYYQRRADIDKLLAS